MNRRPALRVDDPGIHTACCGKNTWTATTGSLTVFINGKGAHRMGDQSRHCGGSGTLIEGSPNVLVGEATSAGAGAAASDSSGGAASSGATAAGAAASDSSSSSRGGAASSGATAAGAGTGSTSGTASSGATAGAAAAPVPTGAPGELTTSFIEIELVGDDGIPIPGERWRITTNDGVVRTGFLDDAGSARVDGLDLGTCTVSFPDLDMDSWDQEEPPDAEA